jgi:hypothetical protein
MNKNMNRPCRCSVGPDEGRARLPVGSWRMGRDEGRWDPAVGGSGNALVAEVDRSAAGAAGVGMN